MTPKPPLTQNRWFRIGLYVGAFTAFAVAEAISTYMIQLRFDKPVGWDLAFRRAFKECYAFGVLALGILWLGRRVRLEHDRVGRWLATHLCASVVFSPIYVATVSWLEAGELSVQTGQVLTFSYLFGKLWLHYFIWNVVMYWLVLMVQAGWHSYERFREQQLREVALATELVQARLQALRMQINPHFFFNTLNTIAALIHDDPHAADRMIVRLSDLLRRSIDRAETQEVPLREEIDFLRSYLDIEQTRFGDRLTVNIEVEPGTEDLMVPFLVLQPLVENAIRHGIEPREEPGHIEIRARRAGHQLELLVKDNGDGLPAEPAREGIGLTNTRSRLMHLYDEEADFELNNMPGGGLEVRIRIPARATTEPFRPKVVIVSRRDLPEGVLPRQQ